jgi:hypothetical protein
MAVSYASTRLRRRRRRCSSWVVASAANSGTCPCRWHIVGPLCIKVVHAKPADSCVPSVCRVDPAAVAAYSNPQTPLSAVSMAAPGQPAAATVASNQAGALPAPFRPAAAMQRSAQPLAPQQPQRRPPPYQPPGSFGSWTAVGRPVSRPIAAQGDPWDD